MSDHELKLSKEAELSKALSNAMTELPSLREVSVRAVTFRYTEELGLCWAIVPDEECRSAEHPDHCVIRTVANQVNLDGLPVETDTWLPMKTCSTERLDEQTMLITWVLEDSRCVCLKYKPG